LETVRKAPICLKNAPKILPFSFVVLALALHLGLGPRGVRDELGVAVVVDFNDRRVGGPGLPHIAHFQHSAEFNTKLIVGIFCICVLRQWTNSLKEKVDWKLKGKSGPKVERKK